MAIGRGYKEEPATFDDVAMIMLFFFLVMVFFSFARKYLDLTAEKVEKNTEVTDQHQPPPIPKQGGMDLVSHDILDYFLYVDADSSFKLVNIGGESGKQNKTRERQAEVETEGKYKGYKSTETTEAAKWIRKELVSMAKPGLGKSKKKARFYFGAHPDAHHGAVYQLFAGFLLARHDLRYKAPKVKKIRILRKTCPASPDDLKRAEARREFNKCIRSRVKEKCKLTVEQAESKKTDCAVVVKNFCQKEHEGTEGFCDWEAAMKGEPESPADDSKTPDKKGAGQ